jgi:hypothetical protein
MIDSIRLMARIRKLPRDVLVRAAFRLAVRQSKPG